MILSLIFQEVDFSFDDFLGSVGTFVFFEMLWLLFHYWQKSLKCSAYSLQFLTHLPSHPWLPWCSLMLEVLLCSDWYLATWFFHHLSIPRTCLPSPWKAWKICYFPKLFLWASLQVYHRPESEPVFRHQMQAMLIAILTLYLSRNTEGFLAFFFSQTLSI